MGVFLPILVSVLGVGAVVGVVIWSVRNKANLIKLDIRENAPFIEIDNSRLRFTNGYAKGLVKSKMPCKNGTTRIEFYPIDFEQGENKKRPPLVPLIVKDEYLKPKDGNYRQELRTVGRLKTDIQENLRDTDIGIEFSKESQKAFLQETFGNFTKNGYDAIAEMITETSSLGMTKKTIEEMKEKVRKFKEISEIEEKEKGKN
jgi:hypothetical protein